MGARNWLPPAASLHNLERRADLLRSLRGFFEKHGFQEVETPLISADTVVDRHLDPLPVTLFDDARSPDVGRRMWLQTSPEFGMKRLLVAGAQAIYQVTRAFRGGEVGALHNPEFTIVEWYRVGDDMADGIDLLDELSQEMLDRGAAERLSYRDAFLRHASVDPLQAGADELQRVAMSRGGNANLREGEDRDQVLNRLLAECVEPHLGRARPTIVYNYPVSQAALACASEADPRVAERFELYVDGIELANGYHELTDPDELLRRNQVTNRQRAADGKPELPEDSQLLAAMKCGLPACSGVALGFDRLAMVALGAKSLGEVMSFPIDRA